MEFENLLDVLLDRIEEPNEARKVRSLTEILVDFLRRLKRGWPYCVLIIIVSLILSYFLYSSLSKLHTYKTEMSVMFNKEREANSNGNVANEIVGRITGWTTTTNKYDEIAILTSHVVVGGMLNQTGRLDSVYRKHIRETGLTLSPKDSIYFINDYVEDFIKKLDVSYTQTKDNVKTSLVTVSMDGDLDDCGNMLIGLVKSYNRYSREYNYELFDNTLLFLGHCIDSLRRELDKLDDYDRNFREENLIVEFFQQSSEYLNVDRKMEDQLRNINLQIELLSIIRNYMVDMGRNYKVVPANTGIDDAQINRIVIQFNDLVMRRSNYLTSMGEDAMRVQTITNQIEDQRQSIIISIDKLTQAFNIRRAKYERDLKESDERLQKMPHKKIVMDQIERERKIKTPLYQLLQEKYAETLIAKSAEQDQARIITYPYMKESRSFGNIKIFYLLGLLLGIVISSIYLWLMKLPPQMLTLEEALRKCNLPCLSVIPEIEQQELYERAKEALLARIRMKGAKIIAVTCSYGFEEESTLAGQIAKTLEQQGEHCQLLKWVPENKQHFANIIEHYNVENGYLILDCGSYHSNPEMPLVSSKADLTLWNVMPSVSTLKSVDFINYSLKEGLVKNGALVLSNVHVDENDQISFGKFDTPSTTGLSSLLTKIK